MDEKNLELIEERFFNRFNKYNTKVLEELGNVIKSFNGLTPSQAHKLAQQLKYSNNVSDLLKELAKLSDKSVTELYEVLNKVAKDNVDFAEPYYKAKEVPFVKYEDNQQLKELVNSIFLETSGTFINLANSRAVGFVLKDKFGNTTFKPFKEAYNDLVDEAVYYVSTGTKDYNSSIRNTMRELADSGIKVHEEKVGYSSGYNRRIDSSVKQAVLTGVRQINIDIQEQVGKEIGADGVELSAHTPCAEDHLEIQGKQFKTADFERLNNSLARPIGEYNCKHFIFRIILGINKPAYTKKELKQMAKESNSKVEYEGKTYTKYEATQVQRKLETEIRKQKDRQIIGRASGDSVEVRKAQDKIKMLTEKYNNFSKVAGLPTYKERMSVSGYRRVNPKNVKGK